MACKTCTLRYGGLVNNVSRDERHFPSGRKKKEKKDDRNREGYKDKILFHLDILLSIKMHTPGLPACDIRSYGTRTFLSAFLIILINLSVGNVEVAVPAGGVDPERNVAFPNV